MTVATLALALSACANIDRTDYNSSVGDQALRDRAQQILGRWKSAAQAAPTDSVTIAGDLTNGGGWDGPNADDQKIAFLSGVIEASPPLQTIQLRVGLVAWQDGWTQPVALLSAAEAFERMKREEMDSGSTCPECRPLTVTGATLVTGEIETPLGSANAPLWQFEWAPGDTPLQPITYVAIRDVVVLPPSDAHLVRAMHVQKAYGSAAAADVTVEFIGSPNSGDEACGEDYTAEAVESDRAVVIIVHEESSYTGPSVGCTLLGAGRTAVAHLAAPLGQRVLLDIQDGNPIPLSNEAPPPDRVR